MPLLWVSVVAAYLLSKTCGILLIKEFEKKSHSQEHSLGTRHDNSLLKRGKRLLVRGAVQASCRWEMVRTFSSPLLKLSVLLGCWWYHNQGDLAAFRNHYHLPQSAFGHMVEMPKSHFCALTTAECAEISLDAPGVQTGRFMAVTACSGFQTRALHSLSFEGRADCSHKDGIQRHPQSQLPLQTSTSDQDMVSRTLGAFCSRACLLISSSSIPPQLSYCQLLSIEH